MSQVLCRKTQRRPVRTDCPPARLGNAQGFHSMERLRQLLGGGGLSLGCVSDPCLAVALPAADGLALPAVRTSAATCSYGRLHSRCLAACLRRTCCVQGMVWMGRTLDRDQTRRRGRGCTLSLPLQLRDLAFTLDLVAPVPCPADPVPQTEASGKMCGLPGSRAL